MTNLDILNHFRRNNNFLTIEEVFELCEFGNVIYDPYSTLIYRKIDMGKGNILYPNVILSGACDNHLVIGDSNILYSNTVIEASTGSIIIGSGNQFGEGGVTVKANSFGAAIKIGNNGRYMGGCSIFGDSDLQSGSQILGHITAYNCVLEHGEDWQEINPSYRAGLLKGFGAARNLKIPKGCVINGNGIFDKEKIECQSAYHPTLSH